MLNCGHKTLRECGVNRDVSNRAGRCTPLAHGNVRGKEDKEDGLPRQRAMQLSVSLLLANESHLAY